MRDLRAVNTYHVPIFPPYFPRKAACGIPSLFLGTPSVDKKLADYQPDHAVKNCINGTEEEQHL